MGELTPDAAYDYIWQARPDLAEFYKAAGWDVNTPEGQRAAARDWVTKAAGQNDLPGGVRDPVSVAVALGAKNQRTPTLGREMGYANMLGSLSGPQDWFKYQSALTGIQNSGSVPANILQLMTGQTQPGYRAMSGGPSWEQAFNQYSQNPAASSWMGTGGQNATGQTADLSNPLMGHQVSANQLYGMTPTQKSTLSGYWSAAGLDPQDQWTQMSNALPQGKASSYTFWGR